VSGTQLVVVVVVSGTVVVVAVAVVVVVAVAVVVDVMNDSHPAVEGRSRHSAALGGITIGSRGGIVGLVIGSRFRIDGGVIRIVGIGGRVPIDGRGRVPNLDDAEVEVVVVKVVVVEVVVVVVVVVVAIVCRNSSSQMTPSLSRSNF